MKMKDGLAGACAVVEDRAIAGEKIAFAGELRGDQMQLADHGLVFGLRVVQRNEMFSRAEQDVRGRFWTEFSLRQFCRTGSQRSLVAPRNLFGKKNSRKPVRIKGRTIDVQP